MKTNSILINGFKTVGLLIVSCLFFITYVYTQTTSTPVQTQTPFRIGTGSDLSEHMFETDDLINGMIGLAKTPLTQAGNFDPAALFHIFSSSDLSNLPLFTTQYDNNNQNAELSFLGLDPGLNIRYGIFQKSNNTMLNYFQSPILIKPENISTINSPLLTAQIPDENPNAEIKIAFFGFDATIGTYGVIQKGPHSLTNYFQSKVQIGDAIFTTGQSASQSLSFYPSTTQFQFTFDIGLTSEHSSLIIDLYGIDVRGKTKTEEFLLSTNPGIGKILASDADGNGLWTDASLFNDNDWLVERSWGENIPLLNLYLNPLYQYVGIGTEHPKQKLHIMDGNILLSRPPDENPCSLNGSILFGEEVTNEWPNGEWGIEYYNEGLNFWKVASATNPGGNYRLFLKNDGNVGINTETPLDRFQVNDGFEKLAIGSSDISAIGSGTSYIGFNAARNGDRWIFNSNGTFNGGNITCGDIEGNYHIITIPYNESGSDPQTLDHSEVADHISMTVTKDGDVGIGTKYTHGYKLAVQGKILCENLKVQLEGDWPDFVFTKDYQLPSLNEVENYLNKNSRLPGMPPASEIKENGLDVGEMNVILA